MSAIIARFPAMPRKVIPATAIGPDWFLPEWMGALRVKPVDLIRETGMSKATISDIVNGRTNYYRSLVNQMAIALRIEPFELLMHPDEAFALRRLRDHAISIAAEQVTPWHPKTEDAPEWGAEVA
jgi:hypothetical protein